MLIKKIQAISLFSVIAFLMTPKSMEQSMRKLDNSDKVNREDYQNLFRIPREKISYYAIGGEDKSNPLSNAFDYNFNTQWISKYKNGEDIVDETTGKTIATNITNYVIFNFDQKVTVDKFVYQAQNSIVGYPDILTVFYKEQSSDKEYTLLDVIPSINTRTKVLFTFSKNVTAVSIKLEFTKANQLYASAKEFQFFQAETEELMAIYNGIFSDYAQFQVKEEFKMEDLVNLDQLEKSNINYENAIYPVLFRAMRCKEGSLFKDERREFSTNPSHHNLIRRHGELKAYMMKTYRMDWAGTNKQATGIYGLTGEKIVVYVEAGEGDPLPKLKFSQHIGHWSSWHTDDIDLKRGKNILTFNNFTNGYYGNNPPIAGGPIYIINPYFEYQQSINVKMYFESGVIFPLFKKNQKEEDFIGFLNQYVNLVNKYPKKYIDVMEIEGVRVLITVDAKRGKNIYVNGKGPQKSIETWDEYLKKIYAFDGVHYEKNQQYYNNRSEYLNLNIRHTISYGEAYAINEHVGIFYDGWMDSATYINSPSSLGWGFAHEIGHMMDLAERTIGESTNNMESKYAVSYFNRDGTRGDYAATLLKLTPDDMDDLKRGGDKSFFLSNIYNFLVWWQIEAVFPGYWGKLDNMYRYNQSVKIPSVEKLVYYSSIITKVNMSYHFTRWGFAFDENPFNYNNRSQQFQDLMTDLVKTKQITNKVLKFWYADHQNYLYIVEKGSDAGCYRKNKNSINILDIFKVSNGYTISLPKSKCEGHLGYEILENNKVINFTYSTMFTDIITYPDGYIPKYKIRAYDRNLDYTDLSNEKSFETNSKTCQMNGKYYNSINEAIKNIPEDSTSAEIILLKDTFESTMEISKNIIISLSSNEKTNRTIYKSGNGKVFSVKSNVNFTLKGVNNNTKLIMDGNSFSNSGPLIEVNGILDAKFVYLKNNFNQNWGGAIDVYGSGNVILSNCIIENNSAKEGGGIMFNRDGCRGTITNCIIRNNKATEYGGGLMSRGIINIYNSKITENTASINGGGIVNDAGGLIYLNFSEVSSNKVNNNGGGIYANGYTEIYGGKIISNVAVKNGGGIMINCDNGGRKIILEGNCIFEKNNAVNGGGVYVSKGVVDYKGVKIYNNQVTGLGSNTYYENINNWKLTLDGTQNVLGGQIAISVENGIVIKDNLFKLYKTSPLELYYVGTSANNFTLLSSQNYELNNKVFNSLKLTNKYQGVLSINDDKNKIIFNLKTLKFTLFCNDNQTVNEYTYGTIVTINCDIPDNKYIVSIKDSKDKSYSLGQSFALQEDKVITIKTGKKVALYLNFVENRTVLYLIPNTKYYLPIFNEQIDDSYIISKWKLDDGKVLTTGDKIIVKEDMNVNPKYENHIYLHGYDCNEKRIQAGWYEYNKTFTFPKYEGKVPSEQYFRWVVGDKQYLPEQTIYVTEDIGYHGKLFSNKKTNVVAVVLIVIGVLVAIGVAVFVVYYIRKKRASGNDNKEYKEIVEMGSDKLLA